MIIFQTFIEMGVKENCEYTSREFAELLNVNLEFQNLVKKWIDILIDEGMMVKTNLGVIICRRDEFEYDLYREMQECQEKERVLKLYKELKENIPATITILRNKYADVEIISKGEFKALPVVLEEISPLDKTMKDVLFSLYKMSLQITGTDSSVLEIGSRMRSNTKRYMDVLGNGGEFYYLDESSEYIDKALEIAGDVNRLKSITYDFKEPYLYIGELRHKMDIIVADNTLHRSYDIELTLSNFKEMLKSGGILLFKEYTIQMISDYVKSECELREGCRLLELGGGTASTAKPIIEKIKFLSVEEYFFSDISDFFVNRAKELFSGIRFIEYLKIDINNDFVSDKIKEDSVDIVIAVGVLNNAKNIEVTLKNIKKVLKKDGKVIIVEAIGESVQMLISQAFMMQEPDDARAEKNETFLKLYQWHELFQKVGFAVEKSLPTIDSELCVYNQKVFVLSCQLEDKYSGSK